jgi:hypothetical protein
MAQARKASARFLVKCASGDVKFVIAHFTENIPLFKLATVFGKKTNQEARNTGNNLVVSHAPRANLGIRFASPPEEKIKVRRNQERR